MPEWITIADANDLPDGSRRCATVEGKPVLVINADNQLYAIANTCPHAGRPLEDGEVHGKVITCPFHGYAYNLKNGNNLDHPEFEPPVPTYQVRIHEQKIQVNVNRD